MLYLKIQTSQHKVCTGDAQLGRKETKDTLTPRSAKMRAAGLGACGDPSAARGWLSGGTESTEKRRPSVLQVHLCTLEKYFGPVYVKHTERQNAHLRHTCVFKAHQRGTIAGVTEP